MPSFDRPANPDIPVSPWVVRFAPLVKDRGSVLDVAAGHGRHSRYFLNAGFSVTAVDVDLSGMGDLKDRPGATLLETDLEAGAWPFEPESFDGILVTNYLHRPHFPRLVEALAVGGVLIIETFGEGNEKVGRPRNPDFLLTPGELLRAFSQSLHLVAYEHGCEEQPRPAVRQRICAVKAAGPFRIDGQKEPIA